MKWKKSTMTIQKFLCDDNDDSIVIQGIKLKHS